MQNVLKCERNVPVSGFISLILSHEGVTLAEYQIRKACACAFVLECAWWHHIAETAIILYAWQCPLRAESASKFYIINQHYQPPTGQLRRSPTVLAAWSNSPNLSSLFSNICWLESRERGRKRNRDKKQVLITEGILIFIYQNKHIPSVWHDVVGLPEGCGGHIVHKLSEG